jgi:hypothetical protein
MMMMNHDDDDDDDEMMMMMTMMMRRTHCLEHEASSNVLGLESMSKPFIGPHTLEKTRSRRF